jgi:hypothetical protein
MKIIESMMHALYNILMVVIVIGLLLGIAVIAETNSWYYLLLYIPVGLFIYESEAKDYRRKKHSRTHK